MILEPANNVVVIDASVTIVRTADTRATTGKRSIFVGVYVAAFFGLLNAQVIAEPLIFDDGGMHAIDRVVDDGVLISNGTTLDVLDGALISPSSVLDNGYAVEANSSTINIRGGLIDGGVDFDILNMTGGRINGTARSSGGTGLHMSGGEIDSVLLFGPSAAFTGGRTGDIFSESGAYLNISGGTFSGRISTISGSYDISAGSFLDVLSVEYDRTASMEITGGSFSGGFSYEPGFEGDVPGTAFTFYGNLSLSAPVLIEGSSVLVHEAVISGTLLDGSAILQTVTCNDFVDIDPCSGVVVKPLDLRSGIFVVEAPIQTVFSNDGSVTITVKRVSGSTGNVAVDFATADGSATSGVDYLPSSGSLTFADGEVSRTIEVTIINDDDNTASETFTVGLVNAQGGTILSNARSTQVVIQEQNKDPAPTPSAGAIQFKFSSYDAVESDANAVIVVQRVNGDSGEVSVRYSTTDLTAIAGEDYQRRTGVLIFADGETSRTINVALINDTVYEGDETFTVALSNVQGGAVINLPKGVSVGINEDDPKPDDSTGSSSSSSGGGAINPLYLLFLASYLALFSTRFR